MIDERIKKVYSFYKNLYPIPIVMFRVGDYYHTYFGDAKKLCLTLCPERIQPYIEFSVEYTSMSDFIRRCYDKGLIIRTISYRNKFGEYVLPDVEIIASDQENDY